MFRQVFFEVLVLAAVLELQVVDLDLDQIRPSELLVSLVEQFENRIDDAEVQAPKDRGEQCENDRQDESFSIRPGAAEAAQEVLHPVASRPWEWTRARPPKGANRRKCTSCRRNRTRRVRRG